MLDEGTLLQNRYRVQQVIGQGGMGAVYEALDERLGNRVALKEMRVQGEGLAQAFEREARTLASLRHAALPVVIDHFLEGSGQYLVMQYIPGEDMAEMLARRADPLPLAQLLRWADQLLAALVYLHGHEPPVLHRDIKPGNLKLTAEGDLILLDFGLAKRLQGKSGQSLIGFTPNYAPLEQMQGSGTTPRSDLYAVGATLYHLLTNHKPPDALLRASAQLNGEPDPLRPVHEINPAVPAAVSTVVSQAMALNAAQRPASASALRESLQAARDAALAAPTQLLAATPPPPESAPASPAPHRRGWLGRGLLIALLLLLFGAGYLAMQGRASGTLATPPAPSPSPRPPTATIEELQPTTTFSLLSLAGVANGSLDLQPPPPPVLLADLPFDLSTGVFKSQAVPPPHDSAPTSAQLEVNILRATHIHLLLNAANGFTAFEGEPIGRVVVECDGIPFQVSNLRLGRELREWHDEEGVVSSASRAREVWRAPRLDHPERNGHLDLLSLELPPGCQAGTLTRIELIDTSAETVGSLDPALNLVGITVEQRQP